MDAIRVTYKLTLVDLFESRNGRIFGIFGLLAFGAGSLSFAIPRHHNFNGMFLIFFGLYFGLVMPFLVRLFARSKTLQDDYEAVISNSGLDIASSTVTAKFSWSAFTRYVERRKLFSLYQAVPVYNVIIPKRAFAPGEVDSFRALLRQKLGDANAAYHKKMRRLGWTWVALAVPVAFVLFLILFWISIR